MYRSEFLWADSDFSAHILKICKRLCFPCVSGSFSQAFPLFGFQLLHHVGYFQAFSHFGFQLLHCSICNSCRLLQYCANVRRTIFRFFKFIDIYYVVKIGFFRRGFHTTLSELREIPDNDRASVNLATFPEEDLIC